MSPGYPCQNLKARRRFCKKIIKDRPPDTGGKKIGVVMSGFHKGFCVAVQCSFGRAAFKRENFYYNPLPAKLFNFSDYESLRQDGKAGSYICNLFRRHVPDSACNCNVFEDFLNCWMCPCAPKRVAVGRPLSRSSTIMPARNPSALVKSREALLRQPGNRILSRQATACVCFGGRQCDIFLLDGRAAVVYY